MIDRAGLQLTGATRKIAAQNALMLEVESGVGRIGGAHYDDHGPLQRHGDVTWSSVVRKR
jgi:hypothetical protein